MEKKHQIIKGIVEKELSYSAHNMDHVIRVYNHCLTLAKYHNSIDLDVLKIAALLHDIARVKEDIDNSGKIDHAVLGAKMAEEILKSLGYSKEKIDQVKHCIKSHRFRSVNEPKTMEAKILFDADKLDIIGAIGIARSFIIAGQYNERIFSHIPLNEYIKSNLVDGKTYGRIKDIQKHAPNIEFEIKLKKIPNKLYTINAKDFAIKKIEYMKDFFNKLEREMKGKIL